MKQMRFGMLHATMIGILLFANSMHAFAQKTINWRAKNHWVDSVYETLSMEQRIAQLMMVAAWSGKDSTHIKEIITQVRDIGIGGLIFFKGTPTKQAELTNYYQSISKVPLLIGIDGEWGLSMRLDSTPVFPRHIVMGAANNEKLTYEFGRLIGKQCARMGIHFNFAPVVDVNNNPQNPVINDRSFGENRNIVARLGSQYMLGMQDEGIIASAKHFPGHGDVTSDSHYSLPLVAGNRKRLDSLELFPFKQIIKDGIMGVMTAHLFVPALDSTPNRASSLSRAVITDLLKKEMGFEGLIVTDALNMKGVADYYGQGEVAAHAFMAGNDILLFVENVPQAIAIIKSHIESGEINPEQLEYSCKKILMAKYWAGLAAYKPVNTTRLIEDLNCCEADFMIRRMVAEGIVVAKDEDKIVPLENPHLYRIASVAVGTAEPTSFQDELMHYIEADFFSIDKNERPSLFDSLYENLSPYNLIILSLHGTSRFVSRNLGLTAIQIAFVNRLLASTKKVILVNHGNAYILDRFNNVRNAIVAYEDLEVYNRLSAQILFGAIPAKGKLPVTVNSSFKLGLGDETKTLSRFSYTIPLDAGADEHALFQIDSIVADAIKQKTFPGCQVLVAKSGKVIYKKSFGTHTYDIPVPVANQHVYDLASLTKVLSTTLGIMALFDDGKIKLNEPIATYLPELKNTNKEQLTIEKLLLHEAGLPAFIPFYKQTLLNGKPHPLIYSNTKSDVYNIEVAQGLYMHRDYKNFVWNQVISSEVKKPGEYVYSDLGFIILGKIIERMSSLPLDIYVQERIYRQLSLNSLTYNPIGKIPYEWIVPTERDSIFRKTELKGNVHDQTAAMMGGVAGHAGLFGHMNDVAIIMQMLIEGGSYGKQRILYENTVKEFTRIHNKNSRRGYGFDKPETDPKKQSPVPLMMSPLTFGHTGFTGTAAWADPKHDLVIVFLSNRVHPDAENKKLVQLNIRSRIIEQVYASFGIR
jgi:beta-glucosidase-like glycosyl hydrolase/CubicO group peptidase (beta-lactamase class C family)